MLSSSSSVTTLLLLVFSKYKRNTKTRRRRRLFFARHECKISDLITTHMKEQEEKKKRKKSRSCRRSVKSQGAQSRCGDIKKVWHRKNGRDSRLYRQDSSSSFSSNISYLGVLEHHSAKNSIYSLFNFWILLKKERRLAASAHFGFIVVSQGGDFKWGLKLAMVWIYLCRHILFSCYRVREERQNGGPFALCLKATSTLQGVP